MFYITIAWNYNEVTNNKKSNTFQPKVNPIKNYSVKLFTPCKEFNFLIFLFYLEQSPTKESQSSADNEMDTAIYAGVAAAGVLLIIGVIVIIILWKRRKVSSRGNGKVSLQFVTVHLHLKFSLRTELDWIK